MTKQIKLEEEEKTKIQNDLSSLTKRLAAINDSLARKARPPGALCGRGAAPGGAAAAAAPRRRRC